MKRFITILILIVTIVLLWNEVCYKPDHEEFPLVKISNPPIDIIESLRTLDKMALKLKNDINTLSLKLAREKYIYPNTLLILQIYYQKSNILVQNMVNIPENFVGLTINELKSILNNNWEVKDYIPGQLMILYSSLDALSPEDESRLHLGIKEGKVAIFYGREGTNNLKKVTNINVEKLPFEEQKNLEKGISIDSDEELLSVLDSFISRVNRD